MDRKLMIVVTLVGALIVAGSGGAVALRIFKLDRGDQASIQGTSLVCAVTQAGGTSKQVSCFKVDSGGHPLKGSYGVAIADNGVAVFRNQAGGKNTVIFRHKQ
jgi:hypothetical protein